MKAISVTTRNDILSLIEQGISSRAIAKRVSVSHMTVSRIRHEAAKSDRQAKRGRPAKLSSQDKRKLVRLVTSGEAETAVKATKVLLASTNIKASSQTVRRALKDAGFRSADPREIVEAASAGLRESDLREARQFGSTLTLRQIIKLKQSGVLR